MGSSFALGWGWGLIFGFSIIPVFGLFIMCVCLLALPVVGFMLIKEAIEDRDKAQLGFGILLFLMGLTYWWAIAYFSSW